MFQSRVRHIERLKEPAGVPRQAPFRAQWSAFTSSSSSSYAASFPLAEVPKAQTPLEVIFEPPPRIAQGIEAVKLISLSTSRSKHQRCHCHRTLYV
jgi:hypothetical protein